MLFALRKLNLRRKEEVFNRGLGVGLEGTRRELKRNACESESERRARR